MASDDAGPDPTKWSKAEAIHFILSNDDINDDVASKVYMEGWGPTKFPELAIHLGE